LGVWLGLINCETLRKFLKLDKDEFKEAMEDEYTPKEYEE